MKLLNSLTTGNSYKAILKVYSYVLRFISAFLVLSAIFIIAYSLRNPHILSATISYCLAGITLVSAVINLISSFKNNRSVFNIITISLAICSVGAFPQISVFLFYALPIFLSIYTFESRKIKIVTILNSVFFLISVCVRAHINSITACKYVSTPGMFIGTSLVALLEVFIICVTTIPLMTYMISANDLQYRFVKEKKQAKSDILGFCSAISVYHNRYLEAHIKGVREITKIILDGLIEDGVKINKYYYEQIIFSVQFHDIGKTYIPPAILDKPGKLTDEEYTLIKEHPARGLELLDMLPKNVMDEHTSAVCRDVVYMHHERLDGSGYPQGLVNVPLHAQVVAVADVIDALLAWRPYKSPMTYEKALDIFNQNRSAYNAKCLKVIERKKDEILNVSDENNRMLMRILKLDEDSIIRR